MAFSMPARYIILAVLLLLFILAACAPQTPISPDSPWEYANLRYLSPFGDVPPDMDLIAAYTRLTRGDFQIRLDLLDLNYDSTFDLYIALDIAPGGTRNLPIQATTQINWDQLLILPAKGFPQTIIYDYTQSETNPPTHQPTQSSIVNDVGLPHTHLPSIPRIVRLPWLDTIVVSLNRTNFSATKFSFKIQAFITPAGSAFPTDNLGPFLSDSLPPGRAPLLLTFWNTFPAYTPAQAIRRWDGAHTGPFGERHGLKILLQAVRHSKVPVVLLDLKTLPNLSALDYLGVVPKIQELEEMGLLVLPDALPGSPNLLLFPAGLPSWVPAQAAADSRRAALVFGLQPSDMLFTPRLPSNPLSGYSLVFTAIDNFQPVRWQGRMIIPLPPPGRDQVATLDGLTLDMRMILLKNAINASDHTLDVPLLTLGGSLPDSTFGDPQAAEASLRYIAAHPWMQPLNADDLYALSRPSSVPLPPSSSIPLVTNSLLSEFSFLSNSHQSATDKSISAPLYLAAWQSALSLYASLPPEPSQLPALRARYAGQVGLPLAGVRWAEHPSPRADCLSDPDMDGLPECILASDKFFAVFDDYGGRLLVLYFHTINGIHQLIAPSSQFVVGLSDPSTWDLSLNEGSEQGGIQGGFIDSSSPWEPYIATVFSNSLTYTSPDRRIVKTFTLTPHGLRANYRIKDPLYIQIPIALDPWERFTPGWGYRYNALFTPRGWSWQLDGSPEIEVFTSGNLSAFPFTESRPNLNRVEDPNFSYPRGHYLPFPIALVEIQSQGDFYVELIVR